MDKETLLIYDDLFNTYKKNDMLYMEKCKHYKKEISNTNTFEFKDFIPYPDNSQLDFNNWIFNKKEFQTEIQENDTCDSRIFRLSANQKFIKNFLSPFTPYNGILLFHSVGVGKTCTAISIAERYYKIFKKKTLAILSSNIKDNFRKQIFDINLYNLENNESKQCTGTQYPDMVIDKNNITPKELEKKINKLINERYEFNGYQVIVGVIKKIEDYVKANERDERKHEFLINERIKSEYSNKLIIIDEAHNLRNPSENGSKEALTCLIRILQIVHNVKLVLMTATPMFNDVEDIISLLNLILANDKRPLIKPSDIFTDVVNKEKLVNICRGYVSYMRGENPYTFPKRLFPSINNDVNVIKTFPSIDIYGKPIADTDKIKNIEIVGIEMQKKHEDFYFKGKADQGNDDENDEDIEDEVLSKDMQKKIQISNVFYPTEKYGRDGFNSCFEKSGNMYRYKTPLQFLSYSNISHYSPKIKNILDYVVKSEGIIFIYSQYYYSGIYPIAFALEHIGFKRYDSSSSLGSGFQIEDKNKTQNYSYAIISTDKHLSPDNNTLISRIKSKDNIDGNKIKVVIVSKIGTEGIDFKCIREVHILEPWYNLSRTEQIIGRAVRRCSHVDLPQEKRNVTIFLHASCLENKERESIDLQIYRIASNKQRRMKQLEQVLQENAIDCQMNLSSLYFPKSKVETMFDLQTSQGQVVKKFRLGDEDTEVKTCAVFKKTKKHKLDESTFNRVYIEDDMLLYKSYISNIYTKLDKKSYTYDEILKILNDKYKSINDEILKYSLDSMVNDRYIMNNEGFLIYASNQYLMQYEKMHNFQLTMKERETLSKDPRRVRLDVQKSYKQKSLKKKEPVSDHKSILNEIGEKYVKLIDKLKTFNLVDHEEHVLRYVLERLNEDEYLSCFKQILTTKSNEFNEFIFIQLKKNILNLKEKEFVYNPFKKDLMWFSEASDKFNNITASQIDLLGTLYKETINRFEMQESVHGFVINGEFKIKNQTKSKNNGRVCKTTLAPELVDKISSYDSSIDLKKATRDTLCILLEILMRRAVEFGGIVVAKKKIKKEN